MIFYYLGIWQYARYFGAALFKELALITMPDILVQHYSRS